MGIVEEHGESQGERKAKGERGEMGRERRTEIESEGGRGRGSQEKEAQEDRDTQKKR